MKGIKYFVLRLIGKSLRFLLFYLNPLNLFEDRFIKKQKKSSSYAPVFIIGTPRSGTTLLYQLLTYHYEFSYFSNFSSVFVKSPVIIEYLTRRIKKPFNDRSLSSNYGLIKGVWSPSEAGKIFKYWFQVRNDDKIINSINSMSQMTKAPYLAKNLRINSELEYILDLFPNALFIHMKRDIRYNAQSLIIGIRENKTDLVGNLTDSKQRTDVTQGSREKIYQQVVNDIMNLNENISSFLKKSDVNYVSIDYDDLCKDYRSELQNIEIALKEGNVGLNVKEKQFDLKVESSKKIKLSNVEWNLLEQIIKRKDEYFN